MRDAVTLDPARICVPRQVIQHQQASMVRDMPAAAGMEAPREQGNRQ
jgi:hypothetical protein